MSMYDLIEYNDNYLKKPRFTAKYYGDKPALTDVCVKTDFIDNNSSDFSNFKEKVTSR